MPRTAPLVRGASLLYAPPLIFISEAESSDTSVELNSLFHGLRQGETGTDSSGPQGPSQEGESFRLSPSPWGHEQWPRPAEDCGKSR